MRDVIVLRDFSGRWRRNSEVPGHGANRGVNLTANQGEWIAVVGDNGMGKSTLLSALAGLVPFGSGIVKVAGRTIKPRDPMERFLSSIHYVAQFPQFSEVLTLDQLLRIVFARREALANERVIEGLLRRLKTTFPELSDRLTHETGRVREIVGNMCCIPAILILDEIGPAVSSFCEPEVFYRFVKQALPQTTVFVSEHNRRSIKHLCQQVIYLGDPEVGVVKELRPHVDKAGGEIFEIVLSDSYSNDYAAAVNDTVALGSDGYEEEAARSVVSAAVRVWSKRSGTSARRIANLIFGTFPFLAPHRKCIGDLSGGERVVLFALTDWLELNRMPEGAFLSHLSVNTQERLDTLIRTLESHGSRDQQPPQ